MIRDGLMFRIVFSLILIFTVAAGVTAAEKEGSQVQVSQFSSPNYSSNGSSITIDTFHICLGETIYDTIVRPCLNVEDPGVSFDIISGPGTLTFEKMLEVDSIMGYYSYTPESEGTLEEVHVQVTDGVGDTYMYRYLYTVVFDGDPPVVEDQYFSDNLCDLTGDRSLQIEATGTNLYFRLISGPGMIDSLTGLLTYSPDTSGTFHFMVEVGNTCASDTINVYDTLKLNTPPQVFCQDSLLFLCEPQEICIDVSAYDPDLDPVEIYMLEGLGTFTQTSDSTGQTCFMPADVDSAVYMFIFRAADSCMLDYEKNNPPNECCRDTSLITVVINKPPELTCPDPQNFFACEGGEFCFDIDAFDYENGDLTYAILSENAVYNNGTVCFTTDISTQMDIVIEVTDECGDADTCTVPVSVTINQPPYITLGDDMSMVLCTPEIICFDAFVEDPDYNISSVISSIGTYNDETDKICFTPDTTGLYRIEVVATDSCGVADTAFISITVDLNERPVIDLGEDFAKTVCEGEEICILPEIIDNNLSSVITNLGWYNEQTGEICFTPDGSGQYTLIAEAIDACEMSMVDTLVIDVTVKERPTLAFDDDFTASLCAPEEICVGVSSSVDLSLLELNFGQVNDQNQICFTPDTAGVYTIIGQITDECEFTVADTINVTVELKSAPVISGFEDNSFYLCKPSQICLPVTISDVDNDISSITVNRGTYSNGQVCFVPYDSGSYEIILTVTDSCGNTAKDTAIATVKTDQVVDIVVPNDTSFFTCELDTVCFPVSGIPANAQVAVQGINTWYDAETGMICYYAECATTNRIRLTVVTDCNTFEEEFTVTVNCNTPPLVILPQDTTIFSCELGQVCIPAGISDVDENIAEILVEGGTYDPVMHTICFNPDTAGSYLLTVTVTDSCGVTDYDEILVQVDVNEGPTCSIPEYKSFTLCEPGQISVPFSAFDPDGNLISCTITNEYGELTDSTWVFNAVVDDSFTVAIECVDACGVTCESFMTVVINMNTLPEIQAQSFEKTFCEPGATRSLQIVASDTDLDELTFEMVSGIGSIDPITGILTYTPDSSGTYTFEVAVFDDCGSATALITDVILINSPPVLYTFDSTITLCDVQEICFDITGFDADGDSVIISQYSGPGEFSIVDATTGQTCFMPEDVDSATYTFVYCVEDYCGTAAADLLPPGCKDTVTITVLIDQAPVIACPKDQFFFGCGTTEFCFDLQAFDPENDSITFTLLEGPATLEGNRVCINSDTSLIVDIVVEASDPCGNSDTCSIPVTIEMNEPPIITSSTTYDRALCQTGEVCIDVTIADPEQGDVTVTVSNGSYNAELGQICFNTDTSGTYTLITEATDECSATTIDTSIVTVTINTPPEITIENNEFSVALCEPDSVCFEAVITDPNLMSVNISYGTYDSELNRVCFMADTSGVYEVIVSAIDSCEFETEDTVTVTVSISDGPMISLGDNHSIITCDTTSSVCVDVATISNYTSYEVNQGATFNTETNKLCFMPDGLGDYLLWMSVTDTCGLTAVDSVTVTVEINKPPVIACPRDQFFYGCGTTDFCFDIQAFDPENDTVLFYLLEGPATIEGNTICFSSDTSLVIDLVVEAVDPCGNTDTCSIPVTIQMNEPPIITSSTVYERELCQSGQVCINVEIADPEEGDVDVIINNGQYDAELGQICFDADTTGSYTLITEAVDTCGASTYDTTTVIVTVNTPPVVDIAVDDFSVSLCQPDSICFEVMISDGNLNNVVVPNGNYNFETGQACFMADTAGVYEVIISASDSCEVEATDTVTVTVSISEGPFVNLGDDLQILSCDNSQICIDVETISNFTSYEVSTGATFNTDTQELCFLPEGPGDYLLWLTVTDTCGLSATDSVTITVDYAKPPVISPLSDTSVYLCNPTSICLPVDISDPDDDIVSITVNRGTYENGQICFVPYDSGSYDIIVSVTDSCGTTVADTAVVTVLTDQNVNIGFPSDTTMFTCELDTICFPLTNIPDNATVSVTGINTWYDSESQTICFYPECATANRITVSVSTPCNEFTHQFTATVNCNTAPLVILPQDTNMVICETQTICLPVGVTDVDKNLMSISVDGGTYDAVMSRICFDADSSGSYVLTVTAVDSCGAVDIDNITVNVSFNTPPVITYYEADTIFTSCEGEDVCVPVDISDADDNLISVVTSLGTYNPETGLLCITPDTTGYYCVDITAADECGEQTSATACVSIKIGGYVTFECPDIITADSLCEPGQVCVPLDITGEILSVTTSIGTFTDNQLCFNADSAGLYTINVTAKADCNEISCEVQVAVGFKEAVAITCPSDIDTLLCAVDTICLDYEISSSVELVTVTAPAFISESQVCLPVLQSGEYTMMLIGSGECGADTCSFTVNAEMNAPTVITAKDSTTVECALDSICVPFTVSDINNNLMSVTASGGTINDGYICILPTDFDIAATATITATDSCGVSTEKTVSVTITQGAIASIFCPGDQFATLCGPDSVCTVIPISPADAEIRVLDNGTPIDFNYNSTTGDLCVLMSSEGTHTMMVIADAPCGSDTCVFDIEVTIAAQPEISCPVEIDTLLCLAQPATLCFPVEVSGTGVEVAVSPEGTYEAGYVCIPVDQEGDYEVEISAFSDCDTVSCITTVHVTADELPVLTLPNDTTIEWCPGDTTTFCLDGIFATDTEGIPSITKICGPGTFEQVTIDSGYVCFVPEFSGLYEFCFEAYDGCQSVFDTILVDIVEKEDCDVCVRVSIDGGEAIPVGTFKDVLLRIETNNAIGGFDLLLSYDASVMAFSDATIAGTAIDGWEYFTFRLGSEGCGSSCPSGLLRMVGIADINNGLAHPPAETLTPDGVLVRMSFQVSNDQNLGDQFLPINFAWYDCGDNSFSNTTGTILFVDSKIYNVEGQVIWDEFDDVLYPEASRPFGMGVNDSCILGAKTTPERCVEFINGGIHIIHPDSIDDRGDINLNNVAYEIGDAVLYSNYFIYGLGVFTINTAGQIAASDVNADGLTLSVSDLVLLIRVIIGDANPIPKVNPYAEALQLNEVNNGTEFSISSDAVSDIGAAHFIFDVSSDFRLDDITLGNGATDMDLMYNTEENQLRVLIYDIGASKVEKGEQHLLNLSYSSGSLSLAKSELVDYQGQPYNVAAKSTTLPNGFELRQNYPNPFNPTTTISMALPVNSEWRLIIYNINGSLVKEFTGLDNAGVIEVEWDGTNDNGTPVASGVYLYRFEASTFTDTKKMILLK